MRNIKEDQITNADAKALFKTASDLRSKPSGFGKVFKSLRKDTIDISDLQQAWKDAGFPDDTRDIGKILADHGFDKKEINKVFSEVFGQDDQGESEAPQQSPTIQKIADYIKTAGLEKEVIEFLKQEFEFKESYAYEGHAVIEDVRKIFSSIVHEERASRDTLIKNINLAQMGRARK